MPRFPLKKILSKSILLLISLSIIIGSIFLLDQRTRLMESGLLSAASSPPLPGKFLDSAISSIIPDIVGAQVSSPYQNISGDVLISGNTSISDTNKVRLGGSTAGEYIYASRTGSFPLVFATGFSDRMTILNNGNVGIGTNSPVTPLHVSSSQYEVLRLQRSTAGGVSLRLTNSAGEGIGFTNVDGSLAIDLPANEFFALRARDNTTYRFQVNETGNTFLAPNGGNVGIGTTNPGNSLEVDGATGNFGPLRLRNTGSLAGQYWNVGPDSSNRFVVYNQSSIGMWMDNGGTSWTPNSDQRLKTNIQALSSQSGLAAIEKLKPVSFQWINTQLPSTTQIGFIAQQVREVFPELVTEGPDNTITIPDGSTQIISKPLGLNYTGMIPPLVKATQELNQNYLSLEKQINNMQQEIEDLRKQVKELQVK